MQSPRLLLFVVPVVFALSLACRGGDSNTPEATATPRPVPAPVEFAAEPEGNYAQGDPTFDALPGATAHFGELGGSVYQIEIPDDWNGRLVLYMHGYRNFSPTLDVDQPSIRRYLIRNGFAWGASSYSNNGLVPGLGADETAALWDHFVAEFGRPDYTYVTGHSMGGGSTVLAAERYAGRFDGGLALCAIAGNTSELQFLGDYFVAAAYAAGVTQDDLDPAAVDALIASRIEPALEDPDTLDRFVDIVTHITGGPRSFAREGILERIDDNFSFAGTALGAGIYGNTDTMYELGPQSDVSSEDFNAAVLRIESGAFLQSFTAGHDSTGEIEIPLLTMHTTGDLFVALSETQLIAERVAAGGNGDLLVQRAVQAAGHCTFIDSEWEQGLEALIDWVEDGRRPDGEDLLADDLSEAGAAYTLGPRFGSPEADGVPGADERLALSGSLTLDGEPFEGFLLDVVVRNDGLAASCGYSLFSAVDGGVYSESVASAAEVAGCGEPGAQFYLFAFYQGQFLSSQELATWPQAGRELAFDASFSTGDPDGVSLPITTFQGTVHDSSGDRLPPGTKIEAYVADELCGVGSVPPVVMGAANPGSYFIAVSAPDELSNCPRDAEVRFVVDGETARETGINDARDEPHDLDLTLP
ncbi:MAG: DUF6351 family protein [Dehalococcoidia bacterium]